PFQADPLARLDLNQINLQNNKWGSNLQLKYHLSNGLSWHSLVSFDRFETIRQIAPTNGGDGINDQTVLSDLFQHHKLSFARYLPNGNNFESKLGVQHHLQDWRIDATQFQAGTDWQNLQAYVNAKFVFNSTLYLMTTQNMVQSGRLPASGWRWLPSVIAEVEMSRFRFLSSANWLNRLRLSASWSRTANDRILPDLGNQVISGNRSFPIFIPQLDLSGADWEITDQSNLGMDLSVLDNRLGLNVNLYDRRTQNALVPLPGENRLANLANIQNQGLELGLYTTPVNGTFRLNFSANVSFLKNRLLDLGGLDGLNNSFFDPITGNWQEVSRLETGLPINNFFGYQTDGVYELGDDRSLEPEKPVGAIRFVDVNGDGQITPDDRTIIGNALPTRLLDVSLTINWKEWELTNSWQAVGGAQSLNFFANPLQQAYAPEDRIHDGMVQSGDYIRLANLQLSWRPRLTIRKQHKPITLYARGENLLILTRYKGFDPSLNTIGQSFSLWQGFDWGAAPRMRSFAAGVVLNL
ncbi:MAG: hypothetical protein AAF206_26030, partial [Bacteroidota bacterium]